MAHYKVANTDLTALHSARSTHGLIGKHERAHGIYMCYGSGCNANTYLLIYFALHTDEYESARTNTVLPALPMRGAEPPNDE